jgi:alpha-L-fucosidase
MILKPLAAISVAIITLSAMCSAQAPIHYEPTLESLDQHPLPQWYAGAKLGIFIHWGLYSVPGWAPVNHPDHDFSSSDYIKYNPYAEWYLNVLRIPGSPTAQYHKEHFGEAGYYDFAPTFNSESKKWDPDKMAASFRARHRRRSHSRGAEARHEDGPLLLRRLRLDVQHRSN